VAVKEEGTAAEVCGKEEVLTSPTTAGDGDESDRGVCSDGFDLSDHDNVDVDSSRGHLDDESEEGSSINDTINADADDHDNTNDDNDNDGNGDNNNKDDDDDDDDDDVPPPLPECGPPDSPPDSPLVNRKGGHSRTALGVRELYGRHALGSAPLGDAQNRINTLLRQARGSKAAAKAATLRNSTADSENVAGAGSSC